MGLVLFVKKPFSPRFHQLTFAYCAVHNSVCVCVCVRARYNLVFLSFLKMRGQIKSGRMVRLKLYPPPPLRHDGVLSKSCVWLFFRSTCLFSPPLVCRPVDMEGCRLGGSRARWEHSALWRRTGLVVSSIWEGSARHSACFRPPPHIVRLLHEMDSQTWVRWEVLGAPRSLKHSG